MHPNSIEAYKDLDLTARQIEVAEALLALERATDQQLADYLGYAINRITGRVSELKEMKLVVECGSVKGEFRKYVRVCRLVSREKTLFGTKRMGF